jgi:hypothetical protein
VITRLQRVAPPGDSQPTPGKGAAAHEHGATH